VLVEGLCTHFIANPDHPDSLTAIQSAHDRLGDLLQRAQSLENDVIDKCGIGQDHSRAQSSVAHVQRVLADLSDVFTHAMLGVDYLVEAHAKRTLKHQDTQDSDVYS
jgi:hypothetical protein